MVSEIRILTSAHVYIFLYFEEHDPMTLYYSYATPLNPLIHTPSIVHRRTAVGLVASFVMAALKTKQLPQAWYDEHKSNFVLWNNVPNEDDVDESIANDAASSPAEGSPFRLTSKILPSFSDRVTRTMSRALSVAACKLQLLAPKKVDDPDDEADPHNEARPPSSGAQSLTVSATWATAGQGQGKKQTSRGREGTAKQKQKQRQKQQQQQPTVFCTQLCLLGLVRGLEVDWTCPNILAHLPNTAASVGLPTRHQLHPSQPGQPPGGAVRRIARPAPPPLRP